MVGWVDKVWSTAYLEGVVDGEVGDDGQEAEGAVINGILDEEGGAIMPGVLTVHPINRSRYITRQAVKFSFQSHSCSYCDLFVL